MDTAQKIASDIYITGISDEEISRRIVANGAECSQPTIWRIRTGATKQCGSILYGELLLLREKIRGSSSAVDAKSAPNSEVKAA